MRQLVVLSILFALISGSAWASFGEGQARFSSGDYKGAFEVWRPLAEDGDPRAQYSLGVMFEQGLGVEKDLKQAEVWFERAAKQNYAAAERALKSVRAKLRQSPSVTAAPSAPAPRAAPSPYPKPLSEREQIEALVHDLLRQIDLQMRQGSLDYDRVNVVESGDGFDVAVSGLTLRNKPGSRIVIGDVAARVDREGDRYYRIAFALPSAMYGSEARDAKPTEIHIGRQSNSFVWDRNLEIVVDMEIKWDEFTLVDPNRRGRARIAHISLVSDMVETGGRWSGPIVFAMRDIEVSEAQQTLLQLGEIGFRTIVDGLDMETYAALSRSVSQGGSTPNTTIGAMRDLLSGIAFEFNLAGLVVGKPSGELARLNSADYRLGFSGFDRALASIDMNYRHDGLQGGPSDLPELTPRDARIRLTLDRLPMETLFKTGVAAVLEYMLFGEVGKQGNVLNQLRIALSNARSELRIDDGHFESPRLLLRMAGILGADAQALWGLAGDIGLTVVGLDALIAVYEERTPRRGGTVVGSFGTLLRSLGQPSADGKTYIYNFRITREGQVLVNGQDAMPLFLALFSSG